MSANTRREERKVTKARKELIKDCWPELIEILDCACEQLESVTYALEDEPEAIYEWATSDCILTQIRHLRDKLDIQYSSMEFFDDYRSRSKSEDAKPRNKLPFER